MGVTSVEEGCLSLDLASGRGEFRSWKGKVPKKDKGIKNSKGTKNSKESRKEE